MSHAKIEHPPQFRTLHLLSNSRWTGPSEPAVNLAVALRRAGWDLTFACAAGPGNRPNGVLDRARARGLPTRTGLDLSKHTRPLRVLRDTATLRRWIAELGIGLVHCHLRNAHVVTALALRGRVDRPLIVRSCYLGEGPEGRRERWLLKSHCDALLVVSERARRRVVEEFGFPADRVFFVDTAIDLARFDPGRDLGDRRADLGLAPDTFVVGLVARIQWRRRFDLILQAVDRARRRLPGLRVLLVGRGTNMEPIAVRPIRRMGLEETILLPGYQEGDDYVRTLASLDAKIYLVPGTDGSCRAVREAMAMGLPVIATRRGMLRELVGEDERGLLVDETPESLADAILALAGDRERCAALGRRGRSFALERFSLEGQAAKVGEVYRTLIERSGP
ncbi:MAG: glycosyltransferase family 4 protein [Myxococcota bacterium]